MEIKLFFDEIGAYVQKHYGQILTISRVGDKTFCVSYSKKVLIKTVHIPVNITVEKVTPNTVTLSYDGRIIGLDMIIGGALKALQTLMPELTRAIAVGDGHRITVDLSLIGKAKKLLKTVTLRDITVHSDSILLSAALL